MMESGELVVRYRARRTYSRRTTEATCEFTALPPPTCSEQRHFKYLCLVVPAAVGDVPLCMHQPASVWGDSGGGVCSFLWLNKRSGCDQLKGFVTALVGGETLL